MTHRDESTFVVGVDFGTDSCRSLVVDAATGEQRGSAVAFYRRWSEGQYCDADHGIYRQHPLDYIEALTQAVRESLSAAGDAVRARVKGLSIATTGSTSVAVDRDGTPLSLTEPFRDNPNAMFVLWKDHSAVREADEINALAHGWGGEDFTRYVGGVYSAEWFWANMLHVFRVDPQVHAHAHSWVEHCDWMPALLTGTTQPAQLRRSRCAAGHKAMWHESFDGLPSEAFLSRLDPLLTGIRERLYRDTYTADEPAGRLTHEWAEKLGLSPDVIVGIGAFDAHMGAVGAGAHAHTLVKVMGTSTCDIVVVPTDEIGERVVRGICGQVDGSVIRGLTGLEAGQSAFGDVFAWFRRLLSWPLGLLGDSDISDELATRILPALEQAAANEDPLTTGIVAVDWLNGRRTPYADQTLRGALFGLSLGSDAPKVYRALIEATSFGARAIIERFQEEGIRIDDVIAVGGVARKSPLNMQIAADVFGKEIRVTAADQAVALGAAMFAAVAAGIHDTAEHAQRCMGAGFEHVYQPNAKARAAYEQLYRRYRSYGALVEHAGREMRHPVSATEDTSCSLN
ncbi:ribulokinase [Paraburkholderia rhizosphaerae]|uniref:Ribulokinase n=1 Tax=Paraburkholderia rhizosphaerae TaxID=480658 RepID=A0A4R8LYN6_9BURK|nr:ribulokinase [Paraburkholderia rhizosphaerae]TDY51806.1 L-ribulokinase [Paraburkholderia rhizosphaerae]